MCMTSNCPPKGFIGMFYLSMMGEFSPFSVQLCTILSIMHSLEAVRVKEKTGSQAELISLLVSVCSVVLSFYCSFSVMGN